MKWGRYELKVGDSEKILPRLRRKYDLIIASPAYNVNKEYETRISIEQYLQKQTDTIKALVNRLSNSGSICWQVGNSIDKQTKEVYPLDIYYYNIFKNLGLRLKNRIIWQYGHGLHSSSRFSGRYETILWFVKGEDYIFNLDSIRIPQKYPGKKAYKGSKRGQFSGNPLGKNPSDVWTLMSNDWSNGIWQIPNVKANHREKTLHPCQFPIELAERCILALTNEDSWILDPYCGSGTSVIAAVKNGRNALGIDKESKYIEITQKRIENLKNGTLRYRPMGTRILQPNPSYMSVAKKPKHFKY